MSSRAVVALWAVLASAALLFVSAVAAESESAVPVQVKNLSKVAAISAGGSHTLALGEDGSVYAWGSNDKGQLGTALATDERDAPAKVHGLPAKAVAIAAAQGGDYSMALLADGTVWVWGDDAKGELGPAAAKRSDCLCNPKPTKVTGLPGVKAIAASGGAPVALTADGAVWVWGDNKFGQLGKGSVGGQSAKPARVEDVSGIRAIEAGGGFILALNSDRTVLSWGIGDFGERGVGNDKNSGVPTHVAAPTATPSLESSSGDVGRLTGVARLGAGGGHGLALRTDGSAVAWGYNASGQLGIGQAGETVLRPTPVHDLSRVHAVAGAEQHSLALKTDGTVWAWGTNGAGELGTGTVGGTKKLPTKVTGLPSKVKAIDAGGQQQSGGGMNYALLTNGTVYAWGNDEKGQLGNGAASSSSSGETSSNEDGSGISRTTFVLILLAAAIPVALLVGRRLRTAPAGSARFRRPPEYADPAGMPISPAPASYAAVVPRPPTPEAPAAGGWADYGRRVLFLSRVDLFAGASEEALVRLAAALKLRMIPAGGVVCREGETGDEFFLIEGGTVSVSADVNGRPRELALLGPGEFFGEGALIDARPRSATVRATADTQLWALSSSDFRELLGREPDIAQAVQRVSAQRSAHGQTGVFEIERHTLSPGAGDVQLRIGRAPDNDMVFNSRLVSGHHALIERSGRDFRLRDLESTNGTFLNGVQVRVAELKDGDEVWVADERFVFDSRAIHRSVEPHGVRLDVTGVGKELADGRALLNDVTLSVLAGEFVAIVGGSGAGKTTLMDALSGVRPPTHGQVLYNGRDYYGELPLFRNVLGYVPQDDIIHTGLPLRITLRHAAKLRLPADTSPDDLDDAVDKALAELELTRQADVKVGKLSGGQRKRASIGGELLTNPRIFFLDEPTSGLDPFSDAQMMQLLRRLADGGSTVVLTTHATKNVMLCDKVVFLARGGHVAFVGSPQRALWYFGADSFDVIYQRLAEQGTPEEWAERFRASDDYRQVLADQLWTADARMDGGARASLGEAHGARGFARALRQFGVLTRRRFDLFRHNPSALPSLVMPPVLFSLLALALFHSGAFDPTASSAAPLQILFLIAFSAFIFGLLFAIQEVVGESAIFQRERLVNVGIAPYVLSKVAILAPLLIVLLIVMVAILRISGRLPSSGAGVYSRLLLTLVLIGLAGLAIALLTSALVSSSQQATDMLSVWIMPQVLFGGALLAVPAMNVVGRVISVVAPVRWAFEGLGHVTDLSTHFETDTTPLGPGLAIEYGNSFDRDLIQNWIILSLFILVPLALTGLVLKRKTSER